MGMACLALKTRTKLILISEAQQQRVSTKNNKWLVSGISNKKTFREEDVQEILTATAQTQVIGVFYGVNGNNLPSKQEAVDLYKSKGIPRMCIYSPNEATLQALRGSNIELMMDVVGETLQSLTDPNVATDWVHR
ncbi:hypothetical protein JHK86_045174 [Glycine max]|nr:hypothetical protein JHK86_045174 [Glycine max]